MVLRLILVTVNHIFRKFNSILKWPIHIHIHIHIWLKLYIYSKYTIQLEP